MDRATAKMVGDKAEAALAKALKPFGLEVTRGNSRFGDGSVSMKFEAALPKARAASKKQDSTILGFSKNILGEQFMNRGTVFTVADIHLRKPKYPIIGVNARGTRYKFGAAQVARNLLAKSIKLALDRNIQLIVAKNQSQPLMASHPVYDYFSRRYGLNIRSLHWEPDEVPTGEQLVELRNILRGHPAKWMIWEGEPNPASVVKLRVMGMNSLVFDPCGNVPDEGDFLSVMRQNVENLKKAFQ